MALKLFDTIQPDGDYPLVQAKDVLMPDGKRLSETEGGAEAFIGTTATATPSEVYAAMTEGKPVCISHIDEMYGELSFSGFSYAQAIGSVVASITFMIGDTPTLGELAGDVFENVWYFQVNDLAKKEDVGGDVFIGLTTDVTPSQVSQAIGEGKSCYIMHIDNEYGYGTLAFNAFGYNNLLNAVVASITFDLYGIVNVALMGDIETDEWTLSVKDIEEKKSLLSGVDLSGYENGTITETYEDGSTITYSFEFDADGNPTKITDSNGNEIVLNW